MKNLYALVLFFASLCLQAQVTNNGLPVAIDSGTVVSVSGPSFFSTGNVTNHGQLNLEGTVDISGTYSGQGSIVANGSQQDIAITNGVLNELQITGGIKTLNNDLIVNDLRLSAALINTDTNRITVRGNIEGAAVDAYVIGQLVRSGNDSLSFPIATNGVYSPVIIDQIEGTNPSVTVQGVEATPDGTVGKGLLTVSNIRYFDVSAVDGSLMAARVTLPLINENSAPDIASLAVAYAGSTGSRFTGLGQTFSSGSLNSGTITASLKAGPGIFTVGEFFNEALKEADSLALVNIYSATNGVEWKDISNWRQSQLSSWEGVTIVDKRVTELDLSQRNLQNNFPAVDAGLEQLTTMNLASNELKDIGELNSLNSLQSLDVSDNRLQFGPIEQLMAKYPALAYAPQKIVLDSIRTIQSVGNSYTIDRSLTGSANTYVWRQNGRTIEETASSFAVEIESFDADGIYRAEVRNENVPGLVLNTNPVILRVSSLERDSASLILVYEALVRDSSDVSNWPELPIQEWPEVEIQSGRVVGVDLSDAKLAGSLPFDITDVEGLTTVDLSGNYIEDLPDLTENPLPTSLFDVGNNKLVPGDIIPNLTVRGFAYSDQKPFGAPVNLRLDRGSNYTAKLEVDGEGNEYQWLRNGVFVSGERADSILIEDLRFENMGDYVLRVYNDIIEEGYFQESSVQEILAKANIEITCFYRDVTGAETKLPDDYVDALLYRTTEPGRPFEAVDTINLQSGMAIFEDLVLDDYVVLSKPRAELFLNEVDGQTDSVKLISTYFAEQPVIDWQEAEVIRLRDPELDSMLMESQPRELTNNDGSGKLNMLVEAEFDEDNGQGRIEARRRVRKASCSLRRASRGGGGRTEQSDDEYVLIAVKETDDEGNVSFGNLPAGFYRINVQYPGVPMDETTEIDFEIGENEDGTEFNANVLITEEGIGVDLERILGIVRDYFKDLVVYPNPADQYFTLKYKGLYSDQVRMKMVSISGAIARDIDVEKGFDREITVDTAELTEGLYMLYFYDQETGKPVLTYKVIVKHRF